MILTEETIGDCRLILGDCLEVMPLLGEFDAVVTDPPYGIKAGSGVGGDNKAAVRKYKDSGWDNSINQIEVNKAISISKNAIVFGGNYYDLQPSKCWLFWDKHGTANFGAGELAWTNLDKPIQKIDHMWMGFWRKGNEKRGFHPTQKPVEVMEWCLTHVPEAQTILDPFMGSGTTLVACAKMGRKGTGIELDPDYFEIACERVRKAYEQPDMFVEQEKAPEPTQEALL